MFDWDKLTWFDAILFGQLTLVSLLLIALVVLTVL